MHAPAGSVVLQNNLHFHAATVRQSVVPRVTLHTIFASTAGRHSVGYADSRVSELAGGEGESRDKSNCHFRETATGYDRKHSMNWLSISDLNVGLEH